VQPDRRGAVADPLGAQMLPLYLHVRLIKLRVRLIKLHIRLIQVHIRLIKVHTRLKVHIRLIKIHVLGEKPVQPDRRGAFADPLGTGPLVEQINSPSLYWGMHFVRDEQLTIDVGPLQIHVQRATRPSKGPRRSAGCADSPRTFRDRNPILGFGFRD